MKHPLEGKISEEVWDEVGVKDEGTEPEAAGVEAAAVKGDAGSDLPQVSPSVVFHFDDGRILKDFDRMLNEAVERSPVGERVDIMDVGFACAYLATPYGRRLTGQTMYVDGGVSIMG